MTTVSTHLFYGLFATTISLLIASHAFSQIQSPILAINLIFLRKRQNNLQIQSDITSNESASITNSIQKLPEEVWEMIKSELIQIELVENEKEIISKYLCRCCLGECDRKHENCLYDFDADEEAMSLKEIFRSDCDGCEAFRMELFQSDHDPLDVTLMNKFLDQFQLQQISRSIPIANGNFDLDTLSPIGILKSQTQSCQKTDECYSFHAITSFSPTAFELPSSPESISQRFKILKNIYQLEFVDHKTKTEFSQKVIANNANGQNIEVMEMKEEVKSCEVPCWQLWTDGYDFS